MKTLKKLKNKPKQTKNKKLTQGWWISVRVSPLASTFFSEQNPGTRPLPMDSMVLVAPPIPALTLLTSQEKGILVTSEASTHPQEKDSKSGWLIRHGGPPCGHCSLPTGMTTGLRLLHLSAMVPKLHQCPHYHRHITEAACLTGKRTWDLELVS